MTIEKRTSNSWRVKTMIDGKYYYATFDHRPTKKEAEALLATMVNTTPVLKDSFEYCAKKYIESKSNILSPSTLGEYTLKLKRLSDRFKKLCVHLIRQNEIQTEINDMASRLSTKTLKDMNGFIQGVLKQFQTDYRPYTISFPMETKKAVYVPTDDDIKRIIAEAKGTQFEIAIRLAAFGLRRSEICAITSDDLEGNLLHINKAFVQNKATKEWSIKSTKTTESERDIFLPQDLADAINEAHKAYSGYPGSISNWLRRTQNKLGMPLFSLHKERHYFATSLSDMGISEADILKMGGWSTDHVMKKVYRHDRYSTEAERQKDISESLFKRMG